MLLRENNSFLFLFDTFSQKIFIFPNTGEKLFSKGGGELSFKRIYTPPVFNRPKIVRKLVRNGT